MRMDTKLILAIFLSFIIYLFPILAAHTTSTWAQILWIGVWDNSLTSFAECIVISLFAIGYQCCVIYCFYRILLVKRLKAILLSIPLLVFLYVLLFFGYYGIAYLSYSLFNSFP